MVQFKRHIYLKTIHSTNDYAISLSNSDPKQNSCIYTYNQSAGRGQIGRKWYGGQDNNLSSTYSWQLPPVAVGEQFDINTAFSLAILEFARAHLDTDQIVSIKWPNDIYVGDRKLAGILIQNILKGNRISSCHMGVGLNVNEQDFPKDLPNPISLSLLSGKTFDLIALQFALTQEVSTQLSKLESNRAAQREDYLKALFRKDSVAVYEVDGAKVSGIIRGVNELGKLKLELENGERDFGFREVAYVI